MNIVHKGTIGAPWYLNKYNYIKNEKEMILLSIYPNEA